MFFVATRVFDPKLVSHSANVKGQMGVGVQQVIEPSVQAGLQLSYTFIIYTLQYIACTSYIDVFILSSIE